MDEKGNNGGKLPLTSITAEFDCLVRRNEGERHCENGKSVANINAKDSGYAWVVLAAMVVSNILTTGYSKGFALISSAIFDVYPDTSTTMAGVMMGLLSGCKTIFAPVAGMASNRFGIRKTMCCGVIIFCLGLIASFFCTSAYELTFTLGAMVGVSHCLIETSQIVILSNYFESKLSFANGIRAAGSPCGGILYPMLLGVMLQFLGLKNTFLLLSSVVAHLFICTALMRPIDVQIKIKAKTYVQKVFKDVGPDDYQPMLQSENEFIQPNSIIKCWMSDDSLNAKKKKLYEEILKENTITSNQNKRKPLSVSLIKNPVYILFLLMAAGTPMAFPLGLYYLAIYSKVKVGLSVYEVSAVLSFQAVFDSFLRLILGWLNNKNLYKKTHGFIFCLWLNGVGSLIVPLANEFWSMMCIVTLLSFGPASFHTFTNVILTEQFGNDNISTAWSFLRMAQGIFNFIHPTIIGLLVDSTGDYSFSFVVIGIASFYSGAILLLQYPVIKLMKSNIVVC